MKVIRIKFATPFPTPSSTPVSGRIRRAASPARPTPKATSSSSAARSRFRICRRASRSKSVVPIDQIVRDAVREIGYVNDDDVFHADKIFIQNIITDQVADIAQGVDAKKAKGKEARRAGRGRPGFDVWFRLRRDAGIDAGADHVCASARARADPHPQERQSATGCGRTPSRRSRSFTKTASRSASPTLSSPPSTPKDVKHDEIAEFCIEEVIRKVLPNEMLNDTTEFLINPTGTFRHWRTARRHRPDRTQDHRRQLRRLGPARRRRVFRQRSEQSRSQRGLHGPLGGEECGRRRPGHALRNPVRLRHRLSRIR